MNNKFLVTCVLLILSTSNSEQPPEDVMDDGANLPQNAETADVRQPKLVPERPVKPESDLSECQNRLYNALEYSACQHGGESKKEKLENLSSFTWLQLRCFLIADIAIHICQNLPDLKLQNYINNTTSVCTGLETQNSTFQTEKLPAKTQKIIALWREDATHCGSLCYRNPKHDPYAVCSFLFGYYMSSNRIISLLNIAVNESKKPVVKNEVKNATTSLETQGAVEKAVQNSQVVQKNKEPPIKNPENAVYVETKKKEEEIPDPAENKDIDNNAEMNDNHADEGVKSHDEPDEKAADQENKGEPSNNENELLSLQVLPDYRLSSPKIMDNEESHAFSYFFLISGVCIAFYLMMYNKNKILALIVEGRKRNVKRRPNSAVYSKLDCNLEEAMASGPLTSTSNTLLY